MRFWKREERSPSAPFKRARPLEQRRTSGGIPASAGNSRHLPSCLACVAPSFKPPMGASRQHWRTSGGYLHL